MQLAERAQDKTVIKHRYFSTVFSGLFSKRAISSPRPPQILFFQRATLLTFNLNVL